MTVAEILKRLVAGGCCVQSPGGLMLVARAGLTTSPRGVWWVNVFAESQKDTHLQPYAKAVIHHDRDLEFSTPNGFLYFAPAIEWPELDMGAYREGWGRWQAYLSDPDNVERFDDFCLSAMPWLREPEDRHRNE